MKSYQHWGDVWQRSQWRIQRHVLTGNYRLLDERGYRRHGSTYDECWQEARRLAPAWKSRRAVILLHALSGTPDLLSRIAARLQGQGFSVANVAYPTLNEGMSSHTKRVRGIMDAMARDGIEEISFVCHSLGGLTARAVVPHVPVALGRIAFLGTPNRGAMLGHRLHKLPPYDMIFGPSGRDVLTAQVAALPVPDAEMLVIAGGNGLFGFNPLLPGDDDCIVRVEETRFDNAPHAFKRILSIHRWLPLHRGAGDAVVNFIAAGVSSPQGTGD